MNREERTAAIAELKEELGNASFFYLTDSSTLPVSEVNSLRRLCFEKSVKMKVVKNTFVKKALEDAPEEKNFQPLFDVLKGQTTILFSDNPKAPAQLIKAFREKRDYPILKAAYIDTAIYVGDDQVESLTKLKSKEEMLGEIIGLLQSPGRNIASLLTATGSKIASIVKTLEEREGTGE